MKIHDSFLVSLSVQLTDHKIDPTLFPQQAWFYTDSENSIKANSLSVIFGWKPFGRLCWAFGLPQIKTKHFNRWIAMQYLQIISSFDGVHSFRWKASGCRRNKPLQLPGSHQFRIQLKQHLKPNKNCTAKACFWFVNRCRWFCEWGKCSFLKHNISSAGVERHCWRLQRHGIKLTYFRNEKSEKLLCAKDLLLKQNSSLNHELETVGKCQYRLIKSPYFIVYQMTFHPSPGITLSREPFYLPSFGKARN